MSPTMLTIQGEGESRQAKLDSDGTTLGRGSDCDVVLDHTHVSRVHAKIYQDPFGRWIIEDLNSHNGVFIEDQRVDAQALSPGQVISIHPFKLTLHDQFDEDIISNASASSAVSSVDDALAEKVIVSKTAEERPLIEYLNEITAHLLAMPDPSELYSRVCQELARKFDSLVTIVRLPSASVPLLDSPEVLACHIGTTDPAVFVAPTNLRLSRRILEAVRKEGVAVMAKSTPSSGTHLTLTIVDAGSPHLVFSAPVSDPCETFDTLYIEILAQTAPPEMFEFIEAVARQVSFVRKSFLFRQRERMASIGQTMSGLAHCIKNVLNGIRSGSSVIDRAIATEDFERVCKGWQTVHRNNEMLGTLVLDMLALARDTQVHPFPTDVNDLAQQVCDLMKDNAAEREVTITYVPDKDLSDVLLDPTHFYRCLLNLLSNAIDACSHAGAVRVRIHRGHRSRRFTVSITDNGQGIKPEAQRRLFQEFFTTKGGKGTGLGLPVTKKLVGQMDGEIRFHSVPGHGTRFVLAFPVPDVPAENTASTS